MAETGEWTAGAAQPRRGTSAMAIVLLVLFAFAGGLALAGYSVKRSPRVAALLKIEPKPEAAAVPPPRIVAPSPVAPVTDIAALEQRLGNIEDQVETVDQRTAAATGNADRAEGLLVAFAARRALDRGVPLGYIEGLLRERFGGSDPQAVAAVIAASRDPVTLDQLQNELDVLRPRLAVAAPDVGWWASFKQSLGSLVIIRPADVPSTIPADRLLRASRQLEVGQVDKAMAEIARLPGHVVAADWMGEARRYVAARNSLDRIETAALLAPHAPAAGGSDTAPLAD